MPLPEGPLGDKDSDENKTPADMKPINPTIADLSGTGAEYQISGKSIKKLMSLMLTSGPPLKACPKENVDHKDQTNKVIQAAMNSLNKNSIARGDLLNALNGVTKTLKAIQDAVKTEVFSGISSGYCS
nr:hypothetical protein [Tanacetum cinerariifolium]